MTPDLRKQFLEKGWVKIENAVPLENIKRFSEDIWIRLGYDPNDKTTWIKEKVVHASFSTLNQVDGHANCFQNV